MDAPPPQEDWRPFVKVAGLLAEAGVHVPQILAEDVEQGFLLLSDLGRQTYLDVLNPQNAEELFAMACRCKTCEGWTQQSARAWWETHLPELSGPQTILEPGDITVAAH